MKFVEESQNPFVVDYLFLLFLLDFKITAYRPKPNIFRQSNGRWLVLKKIALFDTLLPLPFFFFLLPWKIDLTGAGQ